MLKKKELLKQDKKEKVRKEKKRGQRARQGDRNWEDIDKGKKNN